MELIDYDSFTADQLKSIKDNIDRRLKDDTLTIAPPPPICIKVNSNVDMANSLDKKMFIYNKLADVNQILDSDSNDEIVEQNHDSTSSSIAYNFNLSIYNYYSNSKESLYNFGVRHANFHSVRPLFLFKE